MISLSLNTDGRAEVMLTLEIGVGGGGCGSPRWRLVFLTDLGICLPSSPKTSVSK